MTDSPQDQRLGRKNWNSAWLFALFVVLASIGVLAAVLPRHDKQVALRRFVSPVLPDDSRFTLLYPSDLTMRVWPVRGYCVTFKRFELYWQNIVRFRTPWGGDSEVLLVAYYPPTAPAKPSPMPERLQRFDITPTTIPVPSAAGLSAHDTSLDRMIAYEVAVGNHRLEERYQIDYNCAGKYKTRFEALYPKIAASFKVLPPGAPVPGD